MAANNVIARGLMVASAGIILLLGVIHLRYTFWGTKLTPRDPALQVSMSQISPVISRDTTMWKTWIGFNASHGMGAVLFGLVYGYLALAHAKVLFESPFLLGVGVAMLGGLFLLAKMYWFNVPFTGIAIALGCYLISAVLSRA